MASKLSSVSSCMLSGTKPWYPSSAHLKELESESCEQFLPRSRARITIFATYVVACITLFFIFHAKPLFNCIHPSCITYALPLLLICTCIICAKAVQPLPCYLV
eukprot:c5859_g1_i1 orf=3-311(-)